MAPTCSPIRSHGCCRWFAVALLSILATWGSAGCRPYWICSAPDTGRLQQLPRRLSKTGLYRDLGTRTLAPGVRGYQPRYELWSDGATKGRWVSLPPGKAIDVTTMDEWLFPEGTQLWKEFSIEGQPVETRLLRKVGPRPEDWAAAAYVWERDGTDAILAPEGASDARGTSHDVPSAADCSACHGGRASFVLGFSAVQLVNAPGGLDLSSLVREGALSPLGKAPPAERNLPGQEALGYLHANCGHCHHPGKPRAGGRCFDPPNALDFSLPSTALAAMEQAPAYRSAKEGAFVPGAPEESRMIELVSQRGFLRQMPPLGSDLVDPAGVRLLRDWIAHMPHAVP